MPTNKSRLDRSVDQAIAAENRRHLADPNLEADLDRDLALWQDLEDRGEVPMTSRTPEAAE